MNRKIISSLSLFWLVIFIELAAGPSCTSRSKTERQPPPNAGKPLLQSEENHAAQQLPSLEQPGRPNVLLITVDTLRADHLSSYGYTRKTSPNIDALARRGILFQNAMCNWPKTTPSFASILTGTLGRTNGIRGGCRQRLPDGLITLAEVMEQNGYYTGAVVNNPNLGREFNFDQGFKDHIEMWKEKKNANCETVTDSALEWLDKNQQKNFFLWVHYVSPHTFYRPPSPYNEMFVADPVYKSFPDIKLPVLPTYGGAIHSKNAYLKPHTNLAYYIAQYDGEIAHADSQIQRLLGRLDRYRLTKNTLLIFSSDHGEELGEHNLYFEHGTHAYQTTMHVPLMISYPAKIPPKKTIDTTITLVDLFPTILDYLGIRPHKDLEGKSLRPLIEGHEPEPAFVFSEGGYASRVAPEKYHSVAYWKQWKMIHRNDGSWEFFNFKIDPLEQMNLIGFRPDIMLKMQQKLLDWEKSKPMVAIPAAHKKTPVKELSSETEEQLRSLGYIN